MSDTPHTGEKGAYPQPEDFAAAWASKCEELARETAKVTALTSIIVGVVEASRPGTTKAQREEAWAAVGAVTLVDEARQDEDFMARLDRVRERYSGSRGCEFGDCGECESCAEAAAEDQSIRDEEKADRG